MTQTMTLETQILRNARDFSPSLGIPHGQKDGTPVDRHHNFASTRKPGRGLNPGFAASRDGPQSEGRMLKVTRVRLLPL
jgi:hypothetical protein